MPKYRLTWHGGGALDLSQVLDERGIPVLFTKPGDSVVVDGGTFKHPLIQRYTKQGIQAEEVATKQQAARPAPVAVPAAPVPAPQKTPEASTEVLEETPEEPQADLMPTALKEVVTVDETPVAVAPIAVEPGTRDSGLFTSTAREPTEEEQPTKPKRSSKRSGRSSK